MGAGLVAAGILPIPTNTQRTSASATVAGHPDLSAAVNLAPGDLSGKVAITGQGGHKAVLDLAADGRLTTPSTICIDVSEAGNGRIVHWFSIGDPGPNDENGCPGWGNTFLLAHSFTDFCKRMFVDRTPVPDVKGRVCFSRL